jgi:glycosyltransferase involved in cell wall biosynthesis
MLNHSSAFPISVCIITKNEEANIARCLDSVLWADECIVVDSGSTDRTVEIAEKLGARVLTHPWPGWAAQKNYTLDQAKNDWVLSLDADEWLEPGAEAIIKKAVQSDEWDAYTLSRRTSFVGRWMLHSGWYPDRQIRLFRRSITCFSEVPVHEKVEEPARFTDLSLEILHESFPTLTSYIAKSTAYTSAQAEQQKDQKFPWIKLFIKPPYRFLRMYIWERGFLDGPQGFFLAALSAWYEFLVLTKILLKETP